VHPGFIGASVWPIRLSNSAAPSCSICSARAAPKITGPWPGTGTSGFSARSTNPAVVRMAMTLPQKHVKRVQ
jgi:hypothetical protein